MLEMSFLFFLKLVRSYRLAVVQRVTVVVLQGNVALRPSILASLLLLFMMSLRPTGRAVSQSALTHHVI